MSHHCADLTAIAPLETHTVKSIGDHCKGTCAPGQTGDRPSHSYDRGLDSATVVLSEDAPATVLSDRLATSSRDSLCL